MNGQFYILDRVQDTNFDPREDKFFGNNNWNPEYTEDKEELVLIIQSQPKRFANCEIIEH